MSTRVRVAMLVLAVVLGLVVAFGWTFVRRPLSVGSDALAALPAAPRVDLGLSLLPTARIESQHGASVRGASLTAPLASALVAFVVDHPEGKLLIDAGMGRNGVAHIETTPRLLQLLAEVDLRQGTADALAAFDVDVDDLAGVLLTHSHWDHVSGLEDMPGVPVWATAEEIEYAKHDFGALLFREIDAAAPVDLRELRFTDGPYGPFERSRDWFGDGSVVAVPMAGHTPGSVGVFVNLASGARYLFIGDTAWAKEGVDWPAEKPWVSRRLVDADAAAVREQLVMLHRLQAAHPKLVVVPAHDERVHAGIARFPDTER